MYYICKPEDISDLLGLELWTVVNCHMGSGNKPGLSKRRASALNHWTIPLAPTLQCKNIMGLCSYRAMKDEIWCVFLN